MDMGFVGMLIFGFFLCALASSVIALIWATAYWIYKKAEGKKS